jgi:FkbM family methyltransferase
MGLLELAGRVPRRLARLRYGRRPEGIEYVRYGWSGIDIALSQPPVSDDIRDQITAGVYERSEAQSIQNLFDRDEVVVELGAGVGLISTLAMKSGRVREIHVFEADERLVPLINATHKRNGLGNIGVHNFAVTGDPEAIARGYIDLVLREDFFGNSVLAAKRSLRSTRVDVRSLASILAEFHPTVLIVDIEGAEQNLFTGVDLKGLKRVSIEIHPHHLHKGGVRQVFDDLHAAGLCYDSRYSSGAVPVFSRRLS